MEKIAIVNPRKQSGKTTACLKLLFDICTQEKRKKILQIDANCNADLTAIFGLQHRGREEGLYPLTKKLLQNNIIIDSQTVFENLFWIPLPPKERYIFFLPNSFHLAYLEKHLLFQCKEFFLKIFASIEEYMDLIFLDTASNLGPITSSALMYATTLLIPIRKRDFFKEEIQRFFEYIDNVHTFHNQNLNTLIFWVWDTTTVEEKIEDAIENLAKITIPTIEDIRIIDASLPRQVATCLKQIYRPGRNCEKILANQLERNSSSKHLLSVFPHF